MSKEILNENTTSVDIAGVEVSPSRILYRVYTESLVSSVCSSLIVEAEGGAIFAFESMYEKTFKGEDIAGATFNPALKQPVVYGETIKDFANEFKNPNPQEGDVKASLVHSLKGRKFNVKSKNIKSVWTQEAVEDFKAVAGKETAAEVIEKELSAELIQEIDKTFIDMCKKQGKEYSYPDTQTMDVNQLVRTIQRAGFETAGSMRRPPFFKAICSPKIIGLLTAHPAFDSSNVDLLKNSYYMGRIHNIEVYCDSISQNPESPDEYVIVTYGGKDKGVASSSITYIQYKYSFYGAADPKTGHRVYFHNNRYDLINHPLDGEEPAIGDKAFNNIPEDGKSRFIGYIKIPNRLFA